MPEFSKKGDCNMTDKTKEVLSLCVQDVIKQNMSQFENVLLNGVTPDMDKDTIYVKMIMNSISLSANIAVQFICELLDETGIIPFKTDEKELQKWILRFSTENTPKSQPE